ncbi:MAG: sensor histidine kinase [Calditrichia bacterium]
MNRFSTLTRIGIILLLVVLVPVIVYTVKEVQSSNERDQLLQDIYLRQLESILFSVNQYAWESANSLRQKVEQLDGKSDEDIAAFLESTSTVDGIFFYNDTNQKTLAYTQLPEDSTASKNAFAQTIKKKHDLLQRLERYQDQNYLKLEPLILQTEGIADSSTVVLLFRLPRTNGDSSYSVAGMRLNAPGFITTVLNPKLAELAGHNLYLEVISDKKRYNILPEKGDVEISERKEMWVFPDIYLGIGLQGETIADIVRTRTRENLLIISVLALFAMAGAWVVYSAIRREIELARIKADFVSNISHELRTPLALIRMFTETLQLNRVNTEEKKAHYLNIIGRETERLSHLVDNILNFSRMEAGKKTYNSEPTELNSVVSEVIETYQYHLKNAGFELHTKLAEKLPIISGDNEALKQLLINLLDNSIKYSEDEKQINISTTAENGHVELSISDRGVGISQENLKHIFDKFYRVPNDLIHTTRGSGLGLSLVKHIVDAHNAEMNVTSKLNNGTRFEIRFPSGDSND